MSIQKDLATRQLEKYWYRAQDKEILTREHLLEAEIWKAGNPRSHLSCREEKDKGQHGRDQDIMDGPGGGGGGEHQKAGMGTWRRVRTRRPGEGVNPEAKSSAKEAKVSTGPQYGTHAPVPTTARRDSV